MVSSTPTHNSRVRRKSRKEAEHAGIPDSRTSGHLDATVRFSPHDALRLYASADTRDYQALSSFARQISAARTRPAVPTSQASSFKVLRNSQMVSPVEPATRGEPRYRRNLPQYQANPLSSPPFVTRAEGPHEDAHADSAENVVVQALAQLAAQMAAQSAAQMTALSEMMRRIEEMQSARPPSQPTQLIIRHQPALPSVLDVFALTGAPLSRPSPPSAPTPIHHADAYATLVAASQAHPQITAPFALPTLSTDAGPAVYPANQSNPQTVSPLAPPTLSAVLGATVSTPNPPIPHSLKPNLPYISLPLQYVRVRVASSVSGPIAP